MEETNKEAPSPFWTKPLEQADAPLMWIPLRIESHIQRYEGALAKIFDIETEGPHKFPYDCVFDFEYGLRMIVHRERTKEGIRIKFFGAVYPYTKLYHDACNKLITMQGLGNMICNLFRAISQRSDIKPQFVGASPNGAIHFVVPDNIKERQDAVSIKE